MYSRRKITRITAALLVAIMLLTVAPISAVQAADITEAQVTIGTASAVPGETVELVAQIASTQLIKSIAVSAITYDASKMTLTNVNWLCDAEIKNWDMEHGRGVLTFGENADANGPILKMTFKINDTVEDSDVTVSCSVTLTTKNADGDEIPVATTVVPGKIEIKNEIPGDMDGNKKVNSDDAVYLLYHTLFGKEDYPIKQNGDMDGNSKTDSNDAVYLLYYILFGGEDYPLYGACAHSPSFVSAVEPTCTEPGNIAYWHCAKCGKYFGDAECTVEISLSDTVIAATDHTYSSEWTYDTTHHWHKAICEHSDLISEKILHSVDADKNCTVCSYTFITTVQLSTPIISKVEYDTVYWNPVEGAEYYTVRVNDNYECTLRGTKCDLADVKNNGIAISKDGIAHIEVRADGYTSEDGAVVYKSSSWSNKDSSYYYVPDAAYSQNTKDATKFRIGYGYNLVDDPYLDIKCASTIAVLDINKLLTIGEYTETAGTKGASSGDYYSSIDDFLSKTNLSGSFGLGKSRMVLGNLKLQISAGLDVEYNKHKYNSTYVGSTNVVYPDRRILDFEKEKLKYCLSESFIKDVRRESLATRDLNDAQLMEYLYTEYGTHAILGVQTGGTYVVQYTVSTNSEEIAHDVKVGFEMSKGDGALNQIIQKNFNLSASVQESIKNGSSSTRVNFVTYYYGGDGSVTTNIDKYASTISEWKVDENSASSIGLTQDGAIAISSLLAFIDYDLAVMYENYIDERADELYDELYAQFTMPTDLNWDVNTESGENVFRVDLSAYQKSGKMDDVYSSYIIDNVMTIYPVMAGKDVHKIVISGAFDEADSRNLIDKFSIALASTWNRNVDIVIENLGVVAASDAGIVDTSAIRNNITVNVDYNGINIIKQTNGEYQLFAKINSDMYSIVFNPLDTTNIDLSSARIEAGTLYLPQSRKASYEFGGWYDAIGEQVADSMGKLNLDYADTFNEVRVNAKWNPVTYKITLNNSSATSAGTKEIHELYNVGFYLDYEGTQNIVKIPELPQRTGFVFKGYYKDVTDNASANAKPDGTQYIDEYGNILVTWAEFSDNTIIHALWEPDVYTITLDNQGADTAGSTAYYEKYVSGVYLDPQCTTEGKITPPTKDGYSFMGYYESVSNNGTAAAEGTGPVMIRPDGTIVASNTQYTADKTLYALWTEPRYEISFDNQGADVSGTTSIYQKTGVGFYQDVNCTTVVPSNKIAAPKKTGYTFLGYYEAVSNNNTPNPMGDTLVVGKDETILVDCNGFTENKTLYALWDLKEFKVTWSAIANCSISVTRKSSWYSDAKIGALSSGDTIYYGDKLEVTYTANTGYHFEENGSAPTVITETIDVKEELTSKDITAAPIINKYTVVYNGNGNTSGTMGSVVHTYGTAKNLTANSFSRHGWTFTGWKDQNGETYTNGQQVNNLTVKHGDTITLYAQWKIINTFNFYEKDMYFDAGVGNGYGYYYILSDYLDINGLKNEGYSTMKLTYSYNIQVDGDHFKTHSWCAYGYLMDNGIINDTAIIYESDEVPMDHNAYRSFQYSGSTSINNILNGNNYVGFSVYIGAWGWFDILNKGTISGITLSVEFTK